MVRRSLGTTDPGYENKHGMITRRATSLPGNDHLQKTYVLWCSKCRMEFGANGSDIWQRKCPNHQGGMPGLPIG